MLNLLLQKYTFAVCRTLFISISAHYPIKANVLNVIVFCLHSQELKVILKLKRRKPPITSTHQHGSRDLVQYMYWARKWIHFIDNAKKEYSQFTCMQYNNNKQSLIQLLRQKNFLLNELSQSALFNVCDTSHIFELLFHLQQTNKFGFSNKDYYHYRLNVSAIVSSGNIFGLFFG